MKDSYLVALAVAALAAGTVCAAYSLRTDNYCPQPSAASIAALLAPCQAFDTAIGHSITKREAVQLGLLTPDEQPTPPDHPPTQFAEK
jgi:hypothetical protein